jgi:plasmid stabilization system protein ParE
MSARPVIISDRAQADVTAIQRWYDTQAPGLGTRLVREVYAAVDRIAAQPELYQERIDAARRFTGSRTMGCGTRSDPITRWPSRA